MISLYHPTIQLKNPICDDLPEEERKHLRSLRGKVGESIRIVDGLGNALEGTIAQFDAKGCIINSLSPAKALEPSHQRIAILGRIAQPKLEWAVETLVPLGVTSIIILEADHSQPFSIRKDRLERIAIAAMKQCQRSKLPSIHCGKSETGMTWEELLAVESIKYSLRFVTDSSGTPFRELTIDRFRTIIFAIGPEGGFSDRELNNFAKEGFTNTQLGDRILRAELAAATAFANLV